MIVPIASGCRHKWAAGELEQESGMAHPNKDVVTAETEEKVWKYGFLL